MVDYSYKFSVNRKDRGKKWSESEKVKVKKESGWTKYKKERDWYKNWCVWNRDKGKAKKGEKIIVELASKFDKNFKEEKKGFKREK